MLNSHLHREKPPHSQNPKWVPHDDRLSQHSFTIILLQHILISLPPHNHPALTHLHIQHILSTNVAKQRGDAVLTKSTWSTIVNWEHDRIRLRLKVQFGKRVCDNHAYFVVQIKQSQQLVQLGDLDLFRTGDNFVIIPSHPIDYWVNITFWWNLMNPVVRIWLNHKECGWQDRLEVCTLVA